MRPGTAAAIVGGAVVSVAAAPLVLWSAGFTTAGIAAGSLAAKMMSAAAIANGGGVAAGSAVAVLQSAGAAGLSGTATAAVASVGGAVGGLLSIFRRKPSDDDGDRPDGDDGDRPDGDDGDRPDGDDDIPMLLLESDHLCISEKSNSELVLQSKSHY